MYKKYSKKNSVNSTQKSRIIRLLLYPDDKTHLTAINKIRNSDWEYAYIIHSGESVEDDAIGDEKEKEIKKTHYHFVLRFKNQRHIGGIAKELEIAENYVRLGEHLIGSLQYLIHFNHDEKKQYPVEDVHGVLKKVLVDSLNRIDSTEEERARAIIDMIWSERYPPTSTDIARWACDNGCWSDLRRGFSIFREIMSERKIASQDFEDKEVLAKYIKDKEGNFDYEKTEYTIKPWEYPK